MWLTDFFVVFLCIPFFLFLGALFHKTIFIMGMLGLLFDITLRKIIDKTIPWRGKG